MNQGTAKRGLKRAAPPSPLTTRIHLNSNNQMSSLRGSTANKSLSPRSKKEYKFKPENVRSAKRLKMDEDSSPEPQSAKSIVVKQEYMPLTPPATAKLAPFALLPLEVVYSIVDQTDCRQQLMKWTLVSKGCHAVANRNIWANTTLKMLPGTKTEKAIKVLDILLANHGEKASFLKSLCIQAHVWRQTLNELAHDFMRKLNLLLLKVPNLERLFLHLLFFHPQLDVELPNLRHLPIKVKSLTVIANPHILHKLALDRTPNANLHLACFQTDTSQRLPMRITIPGTMAKLTSLDIQNVSRAGLQEEQIESMLKEHADTLRHLGISSGTAARDKIFLMRFPVLKSFIFSTFHCHHHNPDRTTEVLDFLWQFFTNQKLLNSVHLQFGDVVAHDRPLSRVMPPLPHLANLSLRSWLLKVNDLVELAARQPNLESLAIAVDLPTKDPNDNRMHNPRRSVRNDGYVHKHPTLMKVLTQGFQRLRVLSMDVYDAEAPRANCYPFPMSLNEAPHAPRIGQPRVDFFKDIATFEKFAKEGPESLRLFSTWFTNPTDGQPEFRTFGIKRRYKMIEAKENIGQKKRVLAPNGISIQVLTAGELRNQVWPPGVQRLGSLWKSLSTAEEAGDTMFRDLGGMPVWFL